MIVMKKWVFRKNTSINEIDSATNDDISDTISDDNASINASDKAFSKMMEATMAECRVE